MLRARTVAVYAVPAVSPLTVLVYVAAGSLEP